MIINKSLVSTSRRVYIERTDVSPSDIILKFNHKQFLNLQRIFTFVNFYVRYNRNLPVMLSWTQLLYNWFNSFYKIVEFIDAYNITHLNLSRISGYKILVDKLLYRLYSL